jgi:hypothetical protein
MSNKLIAYLDYSINVECPICGHSNDIVDHDDENKVAYDLFNNKWQDLNFEFTCKKCDVLLLLDEIRY